MRRSFDAAVVASEGFAKLPPSARLAFFECLAASDDWGCFVAEGGRPLSLLAASGFVEDLGGGVWRVSDWERHAHAHRTRRKPSALAEVAGCVVEPKGRAVPSVPTVPPPRPAAPPPTPPKPPEQPPEQPPAPAFVPPTVREVAEHCRRLGIPTEVVDPEAFVAFYASKGWKVGRNDMKSWKHAVTTWKGRARRAGAKGCKHERYKGGDGGLLDALS